MQTISPLPTSRNGATTTASRRTTFAISIPHLEEGTDTASAVPSSSLAGSPVRHNGSGSGSGEEANSPLQASSVRGNGVGRTTMTSRYGSFPSSYLSSNRHSFVSEADGGTVSGGGAAAASASPLTKPTLSPGSIRCCNVDQWVPDAHVVNCMAPDCSTSFSLFNRKYHCKMCGRIFCSSCCSFVVSIPHACSSSPPSAAAVAAAIGAAVAASTAASAITTAAGSVTTLPPNSSLAGAAAMNSLAAAISSAPFGGGGDPLSLDGATASASVAPVATTATPAATSAVSSSFRVCNSCRYELHLVISTRQDNGERRRKSRGELKMFQWALVVNILSFLPLHSLLEAALVSSDFYFMSKDNVIWYQYNVMRWLKDAEQTQTQLSLASSAAAKATRSNFAFRGSKGGQANSFEAAAVLQDATALTESEAAKRVISLHARYNFTQFLDFTRRQEMARCEGLSSFSVGSRILLSSPVKVALIGPSGIGKTASVHGFLGDDDAISATGSPRPPSLPATAATTTYPTIGFERFVKTVRLVGDISTEVTLHIYDISGAPRYEALRRFICAKCHAIGLCYDPTRKVTLVEAADVMMGIEAALGPQPVVVCGLVRPEEGAGGVAVQPPDTAASSSSPSPGPNSPLASPVQPSATQRSSSYLAVAEEDATAITVRTAGSLQCAVSQCEPFYHKLLQCLLDRLAMATMAGNATVADISDEVTEAGSAANSALRRSHLSPSAAASAIAHRPRANKVTAQELLNLTMQPCALDILLDPQ